MKCNLRVIEIPQNIPVLQNQNIVVTTRKSIELEFDYPLSKTSIRKFESSNGFTFATFAQAVYDGYTAIYKEENEEVPDPGHIDGMLNRKKSDGPWGIWGHDIGDLYLEEFSESLEKPGYFELTIGS